MARNKNDDMKYSFAFGVDRRNRRTPRAPGLPRALLVFAVSVSSILGKAVLKAFTAPHSRVSQ